VANKRRTRNGDEDDRDERGDPTDDPLGKLWQEHRVSLAGLLLVSGVLACIGLGLVGYALIRQPISLIFLGAGAAVLLFSVTLLGVNLFNVGRHLEIRKHGVRYTQSGIVSEIRWEDIVDIEVSRTDETDFGVVGVRKRSRNASSVSGPLTKTEWDVTIRGRDGRSIHLPVMFLRTVPDPRKLISQLRLRAGL
jgi:hypothetical protein